jgi:hypothetical protein
MISTVGNLIHSEGVDENDNNDFQKYITTRFLRNNKWHTFALRYSTEFTTFTLFETKQTSSIKYISFDALRDDHSNLTLPSTILKC